MWTEDAGRRRAHGVTTDMEGRTNSYHLDLRGGRGTHHTLLSLVPSESRVLDLGCAAGYLGERLRDQRCRVWGLDSDAASISAVPSGVYEAVEKVDLNVLSTWPFEQRHFDVVLAADVLEHLVDPHSLLKRLPEVLAGSGRIIISLPNVAHLPVRLRLLAGHFDYTESGVLDRTHLHLYTFRTAQRLVEDAGLRVDSVLGGSVWFDWLINSGLRPATRMRGLLASGIVMVVTPQGAHG